MLSVLSATATVNIFAANKGAKIAVRGKWHNVEKDTAVKASESKYSNNTMFSSFCDCFKYRSPVLPGVRNQ